MKIFKFLALVPVALLLASCTNPISPAVTPVAVENTPAMTSTQSVTPTPTVVAPPATNSGAVVTLPNPAAVNCTKNGGTIVLKKRPGGGEYGVCAFEENRQCEEWALMQGDCPVGGRKITGYDTEAQSYCAIIGGTVGSNLDKPPVLCELPKSAGVCEVNDLFAKGAECKKI